MIVDKDILRTARGSQSTYYLLLSGFRRAAATCGGVEVELWSCYGMEVEKWSCYGVEEWSWLQSGGGAGG